MKQYFKERVNYTRDGGYYVGYLVNMPAVIVQADSLEELQEELLKSGRVWLDFLSKSLDNGFELRKFDLDEWEKLK